MNTRVDQSEELEFGPAPGYIAFLWVGFVFINFGLFYLYQMPWYRHDGFQGLPWLPWVVFDVFLIAGTLHSSRFRVRVDSSGLEFLGWNFRWRRWGWDEVSRLEKISYSSFLSRWLGSRYRVLRGREAFGFTTGTLGGATRLAAIVQEAADLDDLGEVDISLQEGVRHVWADPNSEQF